jgi:hypothetical protein
MDLLQTVTNAVVVGAIGAVLALLVRGLRGEVRVLRAEVGSFRSDMHHEISALRTDVRQDITALRTEVQEDFAVFRTEVSVLR